MEHFYYNQGGAVGWDDWGKPPSPYDTVLYSPDAYSWRPQRVDVVVVAEDPSTGVRHLFRKYYQNKYFSGWQDWGTPPGVTIASRPATATWNVNRVDIFFLDTESPPHMRHGASIDGNTIVGWDDWGTPSDGTLVGGPDADSRGDNRVEVYVLTTDGRIVGRGYDHGALYGWAHWNNPGYALYQGVGAVDRGDGYVDVASGAYPTLVHEYWQGSYSGWIQQSAAYPYSRPDMDAW